MHSDYLHRSNLRIRCYEAALELTPQRMQHKICGFGQII